MGRGARGGSGTVRSSMAHGATVWDVRAGGRRACVWEGSIPLCVCRMELNERRHVGNDASEKRGIAVGSLPFSCVRPAICPMPDFHKARPPGDVSRFLRRRRTAAPPPPPAPLAINAK